MANCLRTAAEWLDRKRREHMTSTVSYQRDAVEVEVPATPGHSILPVSSEQGAVVFWQGRDWLISAADLAAFGEPQMGDLIVDASSGSEVAYRVLPPSPDEQCWRWSGVPGVTMRIHSKCVAG